MEPDKTENYYIQTIDFKDNLARICESSTPKQVEILTLYLTGFTQREIATHHSLSQTRIKQILKSLYSKP